ncbi:MAG: hypothetical protein ABJF88_00010 [Rhodothermales bacterium]
MNRLPMNRLCLVLFLTLPFAAPQAQVVPSGGEGSLYIGSQRPPVRITTVGTFQRYSGALADDADEVEVAAFSTPFTIFAPVARNLALSLRTSYTSVEGNDLAGVSGLTDTQATLSYFRPLGPGSAVVSASANLPSGTTELKPDEAATAFLVGQNFYGFRLPSLGQGLNAAAGLTYAFPLGEAVVVGLGAAYQVRGAYAPTVGADDYDPGDELLLTGGFDYGLGPASSLALDVTYAIYGADASGDLAFESGNALSVTTKWTGEVGRRRASLLGRFRSKGGTEVAEDPGVRLGQDPVIPTQGRVLGDVQLVGGGRLGLGVFAQGRFYAASDLFTEKVVFDVGAAPSFRVLPNATLLTRFAVTFGDLAGFEASGGLSWEL